MLTTAVTIAALFPGPVAAPAADACPPGHGVTVVVDFNEFGGALEEACVASGGGQSAARLFADAGFPLTYVQRQPSFVCRVEGEPADAGCVNAPPSDAYWALWWSEGGSERWTYATTNVDSLTVPDGGRVAFAWQSGGESEPPGGATDPPVATPQPERAEDDARLPTWVAPVAIAVLFAGAGAVAVVRRRRGTPAS